MLCVGVGRNQQSEKRKENKEGNTEVRLPKHQTYSISPHIVIDSSTIVYIARQLYTHSKNVSLLCFLYTKGGIRFSLGKYSP